MGNTCGGAPHSTTRLGPQGETRGFKPWTKKIKVLTFPSPSKNLDAWWPDRADSQRLLAGALRRCRCLWLVLTSWGTLACKVRRCSHAGVPGWTPGGVAWEPAPWRDKLGALRDMSSTLSQSACWRRRRRRRRSLFVFMDTIEGPRAPAVTPTAHHSSLTRVRAAPLSPW